MVSPFRILPAAGAAGTSGLHLGISSASRAQVEIGVMTWKYFTVTTPLYFLGVRRDRLPAGATRPQLTIAVSRTSEIERAVRA